MNADEITDAIERITDLLDGVVADLDVSTRRDPDGSVCVVVHGWLAQGKRP